MQREIISWIAIIVFSFLMVLIGIRVTKAERGCEMTKEKEVKQMEVCEDDFLENIEKQVNLARKAIIVIENQISDFVEIYQKVLKDKCKYNLKYYFTEEGVTFSRVGKKKIGFEGGEK